MLYVAAGALPIPIALLNTIGFVTVAAVAGPVMVEEPDVLPSKVMTPDKVPATPMFTPPFTVMLLLMTIGFATVPAVAGAVMVAAPDVEPDKLMTPLDVPATPTVIAVKSKVPAALACAPVPSARTPKDVRESPVSAFHVIKVPEGRPMLLLNAIGFVIVPATAGPVIVAEPDVSPINVI